MINLQLSGDGGIDVKADERIKCAKYLSESVQNMNLHLNKKSRKYRYSTHIINLSTAQYLRSKNSYHINAVQD